jgi:hypothetical protein
LRGFDDAWWLLHQIIGIGKRMKVVTIHALPFFGIT